MKKPIDHLPESYLSFRERFPRIAEGYDALGTAAHESGPLDEKSRALTKLALAIGARQEGSVHSHTRRAKKAGASEDEIMQVVALAVTSIGFAPAVAAYSWMSEELEEE
jgi:alkylhydroperoxidase/carboxymuconolactone decarboxylase family protein YurZ